MRLITSYQDGRFFDTSPLINLALPLKHRDDCPLNNLATCSKSLKATLHAAFRSWLDVWGIDRLPKLFAYLPRMAGAAVRDAIWSHDLPLLHSLHDILDLASVPGNLIDVAATVNNLEAAVYLDQVGHGGSTSTAMHWACCFGNASMVQLLHQRQGLTLEFEALDLALLHGHMDVVAYIDQHGSPETFVFDGDEIFVREVEDELDGNGHLDAVKYFHSRGYSDFGAHAFYAATKGRFDVVQWLFDKTDVEFSYQHLEWAARNGHLAIVEFFIAHRCIKRKVPNHSYQVTPYALHAASANGHLNIVKCLVDHQIDHGIGGAVDLASINGHLDIIEWLVANHVERCTSMTANKAAEHGHVHVIQWLHAQGICIDDEWVLLAAASKGHFDMVQWLCCNASITVFEQRGSGQVLPEANKFDLWTSEYAFDMDMDHTTVATEVASNGHLEMLKWIYAHYPQSCTTDALGGAAANGHLDVVKWLHAVLPEGCGENPIGRLVVDAAPGVEPSHWDISQAYPFYGCFPEGNKSAQLVKVSATTSFTGCHATLVHMFLVAELS
ncbi:Aste57867_16263 [Aphanomyces stellatus]|uniref:Aste57867_16263 protein n=1 Tax=Aphanomyces stellatus TaxID=120398 RepID=A0A485L583_9STRA|nr:hypothetical protein As57867_016206 [Aphanomyces stellatus]VFT93040.1 Aste57867_16263 [Aphanomyces stellatus]